MKAFQTMCRPAKTIWTSIPSTNCGASACTSWLKRSKCCHCSLRSPTLPYHRFNILKMSNRSQGSSWKRKWKSGLAIQCQWVENTSEKPSSVLNWSLEIDGFVPFTILFSFCFCCFLKLFPSQQTPCVRLRPCRCQDGDGHWHSRNILHPAPGICWAWDNKRQGLCNRLHHHYQSGSLFGQVTGQEGPPNLPSSQSQCSTAAAWQVPRTEGTRRSCWTCPAFYLQEVQKRSLIPIHRSCGALPECWILQLRQTQSISVFQTFSPKTVSQKLAVCDKVESLLDAWFPSKRQENPRDYVMQLEDTWVCLKFWGPKNWRFIVHIIYIIIYIIAI